MRVRVVLLLFVTWMAAQSARAGEVCIAPVQSDPSHGPQMDKTPAPLATSKFRFRLDKRLEATVAQGEMARIENVPHDRKVLVDIRLDGKPFEAYWIDLAKKDRNRVCLWLYSGYWHWVDLGWDPKRGCKCDEEVGS